MLDDSFLVAAGRRCKRIPPQNSGPLPLSRFASAPSPAYVCHDAPTKSVTISAWIAAESNHHLANSRDKDDP